MEDQIKKLQIIESKMIPVSDIFADEEFNCRGKIDARECVDLMTDLKEKGQISAVLVCPMPPFVKNHKGQKFYLIAGFRRHKACELGLIKEIRADITAIMSHADSVIVNLSENIQREQLNPVQEAQVLKHLCDMDLSETDIAERLKATRGWVQQRVMLLKLPKELMDEFRNGRLQLSDVRDLYTCMTHKGQDKCLRMAGMVKQARMEGKQLNTTALIAVNTKKLRKAVEIREMIASLMECFGEGLYSKTLAWCAGGISDDEVYKYIDTIAESKGVTYTRPVSRLAEQLEEEIG
jgi:ParB/RepB/Spo0J family partition protein